ncbi:hypothetical protein [Conexibacter sp. DBS9H8]|uniref:hypothetical protein n=1 Tax=Conexibacter sp. DBS9H8 TaxID=2937801 RepID=UPI0020105537|nr:hypothetical protein [Conexibacter sp. DBS9H8]
MSRIRVEVDPAAGERRRERERMVDWDEAISDTVPEVDLRAHGMPGRQGARKRAPRRAHTASRSTLAATGVPSAPWQ